MKIEFSTEGGKSNIETKGSEDLIAGSSSLLACIVNRHIKKEKREEFLKVICELTLFALQENEQISEDENE